MSKSPDAFRTISEVAEWLGIQAHVLRFWESKFSQVKPVKRAGGRRYYRPADMLLLGGIKRLLHDDGLTIKGVQKILREQGVAHVSELSQGLDETAVAEPAQLDDTVVQLRARGTSEKATNGQMGMDLPAPDNAAEAPVKELPSFLTKPPRIKTELPPEPAAEPEQASLKIDPVEDEAPTQAASVDAHSAPDLETDTANGTSVADDPTATPGPLVADVPEVLADDLIEADPGLLSGLLAVKILTPEQTRQLKPLAAELRAWVEQQEAISAG